RRTWDAWSTPPIDRHRISNCRSFRSILRRRSTAAVPLVNVSADCFFWIREEAMAASAKSWRRPNDLGPPGRGPLLMYSVQKIAPPRTYSTAHDDERHDSAVSAWPSCAAPSKETQ